MDKTLAELDAIDGLLSQAGEKARALLEVLPPGATYEIVESAWIRIRNAKNSLAQERSFLARTEGVS